MRGSEAQRKGVALGVLNPTIVIHQQVFGTLPVDLGPGMRLEKLVNMNRERLDIKLLEEILVRRSLEGSTRL